MPKTIQDIRDGIAQVQSQLDDDLVLRDAIRAVIRSIGVEAINVDHYYQLCVRIIMSERTIEQAKELIKHVEGMQADAETQST
jgi:hypothetical protein